MTPHDPRVLAVAAAIVGLVDALAAKRGAGRAGDDLVPMADAGIERRALRRLIREGRVRATRIGRRTYVSRADLGALLAASPVASAARTAPDPAEAARAAYGVTLRVVGRGGR
jgi:excisionase family DNA binding protein